MKSRMEILGREMRKQRGFWLKRVRYEERKREVLWAEDRKKVREKRKIGEGRRSWGEGERKKEVGARENGGK